MPLQEIPIQKCMHFSISPVKTSMKEHNLDTRRGRRVVALATTFLYFLIIFLKVLLILFDLSFKKVLKKIGYRMKLIKREIFHAEISDNRNGSQI